MPPWMIPSQPSKRRGITSSVQQRSGSRLSCRCRPISLSSPQAKQLCGRIRKSLYERIAVCVVPSAPTGLGSLTPGAADRPRPAASEGVVRIETASDIEVLNLAGFGLDEVLAWLDPLAHEHGEDRIGLGRVVDFGPQKGAALRVHGGVPEVVGVHLAEALEALDGDALDRELLHDRVAFRLGRGVV